ncbi:MAG: hypothetical protein AB7P69_13695 [Candidatus Binatia bacterium]
MFLDRKRIKETLTHISPYKGLAFFREEDAPFFFGRQAAVDTLANAVSKWQFVAVVGSSGNGKSLVAHYGSTTCQSGGGSGCSAYADQPPPKARYSCTTAIS